MERAAVSVRGEMQCRALGTQAAKVGWMLRVTAHAADAAVARFDDDSAAHAAVAAGTVGLSHVHGPARHPDR